MRPHFGYSDIIYDQPSNESFCKKLESAQYQAALAITGATQGTSREKKVTELGLESLKSKRWFRRLCCMYIPSYKCLTEYLKISFFPASLEEWLHLDPSIRKSETINAFKQKVFSFIRPLENSIFNILDRDRLKLLTRLCLGVCYLNEHRFRHSFQECLNLLCMCSLETENASHYLLHCHHNAAFRTVLTNSVKNFAVDFESLLDC